MVDMIASVNSAIGIAKRLAEISKSIGDAEFKNLLADMSMSLADIKLELADFKEQNIRLREELSELKKKRDIILTYRDNKYFAQDDPHPYCPGCYDSNGKRVRLQFLQSMMSEPSFYECPVCKFSDEV